MHIINIHREPYLTLDISIWLIFVVDYGMSLILSKNKIRFIKTHIFDLLSIIPISNLMQVLRFNRILRMLVVLRMFGLTGRLGKYFFNKRILYIFSFCVTIVVFFSFIYEHVEKVSFTQAVWWAIVTTTTVGYGDISPRTFIGKVLAVMLMLLGIGFVGSLTSLITSTIIRDHRIKRDVELIRLEQKLDQIEQKIDNLNTNNSRGGDR